MLDLNEAVLTTKKVMDRHQTITLITNGQDNILSFLNLEDEYISDEDILVVGLGEIIELDQSIIDAVIALDIGKLAYRLKREDKWVIEKYTEE